MKNDNGRDKYKLIKKESIKNIIEFLDEVQFDAASLNTTEAHHQVNFCTWAINELLNGYDAFIDKDKPSEKKPTKPKSRDTYVDETFMDWNLPEMNDEEYEKLVDSFDAFLRGWEKEYNKKNKDNPSKEPIQQRPYKPDMDDIMEWCELDEVSDFLKDDPELTPEERFELYYDERERRNPKNKGFSYDELLKKSGIDNTRKN